LNNGRIDSIYRQLERFRPTKVLYIVENQGYKMCTKELPEQTTGHDLVDAFLQICKHAKKNGYGNILILEDDFQFSDTILDKSTVNDICTFINNKQNEKFLYYLGCLPWLKVPSISNHTRLLLSSGTHGVIYSTKTVDYLLKNTDLQHDWDIYLNMSVASLTRYMYHKPLCYQVMEQTDNQNNWRLNTGANIIIYIFRLFNVHETIEPGTSQLYFISTITSLIFFTGIIMSIIKLK